MFGNLLYSNATVELIGPALASNFNSLIDILTFLLFLPFLNHIIIPFYPGLSMRIRIGCGLVCSLLSVGITALLQVGQLKFTTYPQLDWLVLPAILLSLGDVLTVVTSKSIIYLYK